MNVIKGDATERPVRHHDSLFWSGTSPSVRQIDMSITQIDSRTGDGGITFNDPEIPLQAGELAARTCSGQKRRANSRAWWS